MKSAHLQELAAQGTSAHQEQVGGLQLALHGPSKHCDLCVIPANEWHHTHTFQDGLTTLEASSLICMVRANTAICASYLWTKGTIYTLLSVL